MRHRGNDEGQHRRAVPAFGPRMVCTRCGIIRADARLSVIDADEAIRIGLIKSWSATAPPCSGMPVQWVSKASSRND